ncbi:MAG: DUF4907 domain-containing protein [Ginsengibacter sp.]
MTKRYFITIGVLLITLMIIGFSIKTNEKNDEEMLLVESVPVQSATGWGYDILVDHKIFIHQEYIPAIVGEKVFLSKEEAMRTAGLAIEKLKKGKLPTITKSDLSALKISF